MDEERTARDEFVLPLTLIIEEDGCTYNTLWKYSSLLLVKRFDSAEDLLTTFLNGDFQALVSTSDLANMEISDAPEFYQWLTTFDRTHIMEIMNLIYFSGSADVESLPPSQRLRVCIAFSRDPFSVEAQEQECSAYLSTMHKHMEVSQAQYQYFHQNTFERKLPQMRANYEAACRALHESGVRIPRETMARFQAPRELVMWLLRKVITEDKYIKSCEFCERYFIPQRNTKQYCSKACANKQRNLDAFCGEKEVGAAYKRIVVNLSNKDKKQKELRRQYCVEDGTVVSPRELLRRFYEENYQQQERFRAAWEGMHKSEEKSWELRRAYEEVKADYLEWLSAQLSFAKRIHIDNDSYWDGSA